MEVREKRRRRMMGRWRAWRKARSIADGLRGGTRRGRSCSKIWLVGIVCWNQEDQMVCWRESGWREQRGGDDAEENGIEWIIVTHDFLMSCSIGIVHICREYFWFETRVFLDAGISSISSLSLGVVGVSCFDNIIFIFAVSSIMVDSIKVMWHRVYRLHCTSSWSTTRTIVWTLQGRTSNIDNTILSR